MIEKIGIGGMRKLLIERHDEFMDVLQREGRNVFSSGTETINGITYFRIVLKRESIKTVTIDNIEHFVGKTLFSDRPQWHHYPLKIRKGKNGNYYYSDRNGVEVRFREDDIIAYTEAI